MTLAGAGIRNGSNVSGVFISGLIRFHETCAFCTALNSFAAFEDLTDSLTKQDKKVVNAAMSQVLQPVPRTLRAPNH